jgi:hypothetical protein
MSTSSSTDSVLRPLTTRLLVAFGVTAVAGAVLWLFLEVLVVASVWPPLESPPRQGEAVLVASIDTGQPVHDPAARARAVREPQNAWSCLAFVLVAAMLVQGARDALARWFGLTVAIAGLCAMFYHASASREFRHADIAGLYWACALVAFIAATRLGVFGAQTNRGLPAFLIWLGFGGLAIAATAWRNIHLGGFKPLQVPVVTAVIALLVGSMLLVYCLRQSDPRKWRLGLGAMALMTIGFVLETGDHPGGAWCVPGALVQPHAAWHVLCAASLGLALECFESPTRAVAGRAAKTT